MAKKKKDIGHEETENVLSDLEKRINAEYKQAEEEITEKLNTYVKKFEIKDNLKQQAVANGQITQSEYLEWRVGQIAMGNRWEEMRDTIATDLTNTAEIAKSITYGYMPEVYAINHNYGTFQVESLSKVNTSYTLYDAQSVERLFDDENTIYHKAGAKVTAAINRGEQEAWDKKKVQSCMIQSLLQGESISQIATRLSTTVGESDRKAAIRNARTMTTGVENAGRVDSYKRAEAMGINLEQEWLATLDGRTRHEHRELDGQRVKVGEKFKVAGYEIAFPADPTAPAFLVYNCRCTLIAALAGHTKDASDTSIRNTNHMEEETYEEWKESKNIHSDSITKQDDIADTMKRKYGSEYASYSGGTKKSYTKSTLETTTSKSTETVIEIPENVQTTLEAFEKKYTNAKTEHYVSINSNGQTIFESSSKGKRSVSVPKHIDEQMEGGYSIHNHPAKAVFSAADIKNYEKYGEHGFVIDNEGNEYLLYNLNPVSKYKEAESAGTEEELAEVLPFYSKVYSVFNQIEDDTLESRRAYVKELTESGVDRETRSKLLDEWYKNNNSDDKEIAWLEENAEEYGFIFRKKKR